MAQGSACGIGRTNPGSGHDGLGRRPAGPPQRVLMVGTSGSARPLKPHRSALPPMLQQHRQLGILACGHHRCRLRPMPYGRPSSRRSRLRLRPSPRSPVANVAHRREVGLPLRGGRPLMLGLMDEHRSVAPRVFPRSGTVSFRRLPGAALHPMTPMSWTAGVPLTRPEMPTGLALVRVTAAGG